MTSSQWTKLAVLTATLALGFSAIGLAALSTAQGPRLNAHPPTVSARLTVDSGPSCTATVSGENAHHNAVQSTINTYASTPGATICLGAGTFPEQLTITHTVNFSLLGAGNGSTFLIPTTATANQNGLDSGLPYYAIIGANNDSNLTVANLAINGSSAVSSVPGCDGFLGIYYANTSGTIAGTRVTAIDQHNGCQAQNAIFANNGYFATGRIVDLAIAVTNNTVQDFGKNGITCNDPGLTCRISGNTVATHPMVLGLSATNGIQLYGSNGSILRNTVEGDNYLPSWCTAGNYFFAGNVSCTALADATGILLYAPGNGVNVSGNTLAGNQIGIADVGGPMVAWDNTVRSAGFYGLVIDFNTSLNWLGSPLYSTGPFAGVAGGNTIDHTNVGVLVYDDNATLTGNTLAGTNVSFEVATDLPVGYAVSLTGNSADANLSGALLGDVSSYQPGVAAYPSGTYTLSDDSFTNVSTNPSPGLVTPRATFLFGASASVQGSTFTGFSHGLAVVLTQSGGLNASGNTITAPLTASPGDGAYFFAGNASIYDNSVSGYSWMNGPGWWPNSQDAGVFAQCYAVCDVVGNHVTNDAIGIAVLSYLYGPLPAPSWPYAAPASVGPVLVAHNVVTGSGAFGIAFELNQGPSALSSAPYVTVRGNTIDNSATGAVGLMVDQGTYGLDANTFVGTTAAGTSGASQPTGVGTIDTASVQVLNAYDANTSATLNGNVFEQTVLYVALLNLTSGGGFAQSYFGEPVNFTETGLPLADRWAANVSGAAPAILPAGAGATVDLSNGSVAYTAQSFDKLYAPTVPSGTLAVAGAPLAIVVDFQLVTYNVTFQETGLSAGTSWSVTIGATTLTTTGTSVTFALANGSYSYSVSHVTNYALAAYSGSFTVAGAPRTFTEAYVLQQYQVEFDETGLPASTTWNVTLGAQTMSSSTAAIDFEEINGTYAYTIGSIPNYAVIVHGSVHVAGGPVTVPVTFVLQTYAFTFTETGLPSGTNWSVTIGATTLYSTTASIGFSLANGSYAYSVGAVPNYARLAHGTILVSGAPGSKSVAFVLQQYKVTFKEKHLPLGTSWSVTVNGTTHTATVNKIAFVLLNGTYPFSVGVVPGWHLPGFVNTGTLVVSGSSFLVTELFQKTTYKVTFTETGLPHGSTWYVKVGATNLSATINQIVFHLANKTYSFKVTGPVGFTPSPGSGTLTVNGANVSKAITFS